MSTVRELHNQAMDYYDQALIKRRLGDRIAENELLAAALKWETEAAQAMVPRLDVEPTRSILMRGVATIAQALGKTREAERWIALGLGGNPPDDIADELRNLLEQVNLERHLSLRGVILQPDDLQLSLSGPSVGCGVMEMDEFVVRCEAAKKLTIRTIARLMSRPFQEFGRPPKQVIDTKTLFLSVPRAASFAVTLRLSSPGQQQELEAIGMHSQVFDDMFECFSFLQQDQIDALQKKITDEAYYNNFIELAKIIAPDGKRVSQVGITLFRNGTEKRLSLTKTRKSIPSLAATSSARRIETDVQIRGYLKFADSIKPDNKIKLLDSNGKTHSFLVPPGMMGDIVSGHWNEEVEITGTKSQGVITLSQIDRVD